VKPLNADFFAGLSGPVEFIIIRHGQSEGNAAKILQGQEEYPLSEQGRSQAVARGRFLKTILAGTERGKILFFSSSQKRALETAHIIGDEARLPMLFYSNDLIEMQLGVWTGKTWDEVKGADPALWAGFMARGWDAIPSAESSAALYQRALRAWTDIRDTAIQQKSEKVVIVSHGGLIQWLLKTTLRCHNWFPLFPVSNCGQFKLYVEPRPAEKSVYTRWEEINSSIPGENSDPADFPS
jgi:broad specificity phosphatase PhoE